MQNLFDHTSKMKKNTKGNNLLMHAFILATVLTTAKSTEAEVTMEAAFQGHCGHTSPCEQLCYEIHDGMYECDCIEGYELNKNGYSCQVINSTSTGNGINDDHSKADEDVLYQKGASFSAKLANDNERDNKLTAIYDAAEASSSSLSSSSSSSSMSSALSSSLSAMASSSSGSASDEIIDNDDDGSNKNDAAYNYDYNEDNFSQQEQEKQQQSQTKQQQQTVNSNDYYISAESINFNQDQNQDQGLREGISEFEETATEKSSASVRVPATSSGLTGTGAITAQRNNVKAIHINKVDNIDNDNDNDNDNTYINNNNNDDDDDNDEINSEDYNYYYKSDISTYNDDDDVNHNNQLILRKSNNINSKKTYQTQKVQMNNKISLAMKNSNNKIPIMVVNRKKALTIDPIMNSNNVAAPPTASSSSTATAATTTTTTRTITSATTKHGATIASTENINISNEQMNNDGSAQGINSATSCNLDCGPDGICDNSDGNKRCMCTFGKTGNGCSEEIKARVPKFSKKSWLAFPALRGAYKHVQLRIEFQPKSFDGVILLSGERDDLTGDFMALLLNKGFVEFWFDCGSGVGSVRSRETITLNEWNSVIIYRHRWDAWLVLNHGTKVQGRSNGLFSRITFREPVFLGGTGNITGLAKRLPVSSGFVGCIRRFVANEHDYKFDEHPLGDVIKGFDIQDCINDKCVKYPCQHGGKCLPSDQGAVCLCPIGFVGDLCEIRMDLQVPAFNGSSFLRYAPIGENALIWLELKVTLKPEQADGLILYSGPEKHGDFIALYIHHGFVEFAFDLGSGPAVVRSEHALSVGQWHTIKLSRTARLAVLKIDHHQEVMTVSSNGFWHLSLAENLFVGGVNHIDRLPMDLKYRPFFVGCIQRIDINGHSLGIVAEALGGSNIGNCPHACLARPCGPLAKCVPQMEGFECRCSVYNERCNKAAEVAPEEIQMQHKLKNNRNDNNKGSKDTTISSSSSSNSNSRRKSSSYECNANDNGAVVRCSKKSEMALQTKHNGVPETKQEKKMRVHKKLTKKHRYLHKLVETTERTTTMPRTTTTTTTTTTPEPPTTPRTTTTMITVGDNEEIEDDIIYRDVHTIEMHKLSQFKEEDFQEEQQQQRQRSVQKHHGKDKRTHHHHHHHPAYPLKYHNTKHDPYQKTSTFGHKLSMLPTHYESFQTNPDSDILTFDDNVDWAARVQQEEFNQQEPAAYQHKIDNKGTISKPSSREQQTYNTKTNKNTDTEPESFVFDESLFDAQDDTEDYQRKQLAQDMERIMSNKPKSAEPKAKLHDDTEEYNYDSEEINHNEENDEENENIDDDLLTPIMEKEHTPRYVPGLGISTTPQTHTDWSLLKKFDLSAEHQSKIGVRKNFGACFAGIDSYFHYNDADTMSQIISYSVDLNLRIKTHSENGVILWTGRQDGTEENDDFLSLGIENGYLHFRYDLGSGDVDIRFNVTKVSDGLWHRVRAIRNSQDGYLEVDGRKTEILHAPGKLRQLNTDTGLYVGGMPDASYFTRRKYANGITGCISEIVLAGELKLNFDPNTLGTAHNVETGLL